MAMETGVRLIAPPRCKGDLALRILGLALDARDYGLEYESWSDAAHQWSMMIRSGRKVVFLLRDEVKQLISIEMTSDVWVPKYGKCGGCFEKKMMNLRRWILDFHAWNPDSVRLVWAEDLSDYERLRGQLDGFLNVDEERHAREIQGKSNSGEEHHDNWVKKSAGDLDENRDKFAAAKPIPSIPQIGLPWPEGEPMLTFEEMTALEEGREVEVLSPEQIWKQERSRRKVLGITERVLRPLPELRVKPKTVVYTLQWGSPDWLAVCFPTLEEWTERWGYRLRVWNEQDGFPDGVHKKFACVWMLREFLKSGEEQMIYVDADVYIHPLAGEFDPVYGVSATRDLYMKKERWENWLQSHRLGASGGFVHRNAGVWACDRSGAEAILRQAAKGYWFLGVMEQMQFNAWLRDAQREGVMISALAEEWNMLVGGKTDPAFFYHLTSAKDKLSLLKKLQILRMVPQTPTRLPEWSEERVPAAICIPWKKNADYMGELRLAVKSWRKFFTEAWPIYILGAEAPEWLSEELDCHFVHAPSYEMALGKAVQIAERMIFTNDDIFLLRACGPDDLKVWYQGVFEKVEELLDHENAWYKKVGELGLELAHYGVFKPRCFSLHVPYLWDGRKATELLAKFRVVHKLPFEMAYGELSGEPVERIGNQRALAVPCPDEALFFNVQTNEGWAGGVKAWLEERIGFVLPEPVERNYQRKIYFLTRERKDHHEEMIAVLERLGQVTVVEDVGPERAGFRGMTKAVTGKEVTAYDRAFELFTGAEPVWLVEDDVTGSVESLSAVMDAGDAMEVDLCATQFLKREESFGWALWDVAPDLEEPLLRAFTPLCRLSAWLVNEIHARRLKLGYHEHHELSFSTLARTKADLRELVPDAFGSFAWRPILKAADPRGKIVHPVKF